jgi:hypothetical protein
MAGGRGMMIMANLLIPPSERTQRGYEGLEF